MTDAPSSERESPSNLKARPLTANSDLHLVHASAFPASEVWDITAAVRGLPRHRVEDFQFPRAGFFRKLDRLLAELDDVSEFIHLETTGRSYVLRIRYR